MTAGLEGRLDRAAYTLDRGPYVPIGEPLVRTRAHSVLDLGTNIRLRDTAWLDLELQNAAGIKYAELRASGYLNPGRPRTLRAAIRLGNLDL